MGSCAVGYSKSRLKRQRFKQLILFGACLKGRTLAWQERQVVNVTSDDSDPDYLEDIEEIKEVLKSDQTEEAL